MGCITEHPYVFASDFLCCYWFHLYVERVEMVVAMDRQQQQQQQQGGRGRGAAASQPTHWRDVVRSDDAGERPPWRLTCYAHERSGDNDLVGDTSFEELRWSQVQV